MVASNNLKTGSQLTLIPKRSQPLYFSVPDDVLENNSQLKIQLSFVGENPGVVRVESQEFAIAPQTEPLQLSLPDVSEYKTSNQALVISKSIDKSSLFSSSEAQASQGGVGDTPQPVSNRLAVYKLKGS
jgi:hypothetical protein